jgi:hypothetical protein
MGNTLRFSGRVIPEISNITIADHPSLRWQDQPDGFEMTIKVTIENSQITVDCEFDVAYDRSKHFKPAHMRAIDIASAAVNLTAFGLGMGIFVVIDKYSEPEGKEMHLIYRDHKLEALASVANPAGPNFSRALDVVYQDIRMFTVLGDLVRANSVPSAVPASCGSAVEAIRSLMVPKGTDRSEGWPLLRNSLNVTKEYLKLVTDHATPARHGEHPYVDGGTTEKIAHRAWTLLNRYFEYRIRGGKPLPVSEFPLLTEQ